MRQEDIIIKKFSINFGLGYKNPVQQVQFYSHEAQSEKNDTKNQSRNLKPDQYSEYYLRVFVRKEERALEAKLAFERFLAKFNI